MKWYPWGELALIIFTPLLSIALFQMWRRRKRVGCDVLLMTILPVLVGLAVASCGIYCMFWWDKPHHTYIWQPDCSIVCWRYCTTYSGSWGNATILSGIAVMLGGILSAGRSNRIGSILSIVAGIATFPAETMAIYAGWLAWGRKRQAL